MVQRVQSKIIAKPTDLLVAFFWRYARSHQHKSPVTSGKLFMFTDVIGNLTKLEELDLSHNQLAHFPENSIGPNVSTSSGETWYWH